MALVTGQEREDKVVAGLGLFGAGRVSRHARVLHGRHDRRAVDRRVDSRRQVSDDAGGHRAPLLVARPGNDSLHAGHRGRRNPDAGGCGRRRWSSSAPVAAVAPEHGWFVDRPLFGVRVLVTRPAHQARRAGRGARRAGRRGPVRSRPSKSLPPDDWQTVDRALAQLGPLRLARLLQRQRRPLAFGSVARRARPARLGQHQAGGHRPGKRRGTGPLSPAGRRRARRVSLRIAGRGPGAAKPPRASDFCWPGPVAAARCWPSSLHAQAATSSKSSSTRAAT